MRYSALVAIIALSLRLSQCACLFAEDIPQLRTPEKPQLRTILADDFANDSLADYQVEGDATWEPGHFVLQPEASIGRPLETSQRSKITIALTKGDEAEALELDKQGDNEVDELAVHQTLIFFTLQDGNILLMNLAETHSETDTRTAISLEFVIEREGEVATETIKEELFDDSLYSGKWELQSDHGYVQLFRNNQKILSAFSPRLASAITELGVSQITGETRIRSLELKTGSIPEPLNDAQKVALENAEEKLEEGIRFYNQGQQQKALESIENAFNQISESFNQEHERYLYFLEKLIAICSVQDQVRAKTLRQHRCKLAAQILGNQHPGYAQQIHELAFLYYDKGDYARAVDLLKTSRQVIKQTLGVHDASYAIALESIEQCSNNLADHPSVYEALIELLSISNQLYGEESDESCQILLRLGVCFFMQGDETEAESHFLRVKTIRKQSMGGGFLGFAGVDDEENGILVLSVEDQGPSARSGLGPGDKIVAVGGHAIGVWSDLSEASSNFKPGMRLEIKILRDGETIETSLTLGEHPLHNEANQKLADFYTRREDYKTAEPLLVEMSDISKAVSGRESAEYARALKNLSNLYNRTLQYRKSQEMCLEWYAIKEKTLAGEPTVAELLEYSEVLNRLGWAAKRNRELELSLSAFTQSASVIQEVKGEEAPEFAVCLQNLGYAHMELMEFEESKDFFDQAITIQKTNTEVNKEDYAESLSGLALVLLETGDYERAKKCLSQSLEILGDDHSGYELGLLAQIYLTQGNYDEAKTLGQEAWAKAKQKIGPKDPNYPSRVHDLAIIYLKTGDFDRSEPLLQKSLESAKNILGGQSDVYATILGTLGEMYREQGDYVSALTHLQQASDILENGNPEHYSDTLNNMAMTYIAMGNIRKASPLFEQSEEIKKILYGVDHPNYAIAVNNSALMFSLTGQLDLAREYLQQAADIKKRSFGQDHPSYALSLNNLANNCRLRGDHAEAIRLFTETVEIVKASLGEEHPTYATCLFNLGLSYFTKGDYPQAENHLNKSQEIRERVLGDEHPDSAVGIGQLAELYWVTGNEKKAGDLLRQSFERSFSLATRYSAGQSQSEQLRYAVWLQESLHKIVSFGLNSGSPDPSIYDDILNWKGMTLLRQREYRKLVEDGETEPILAALEQVTRQLSTQLRSVPEGNGVKEWATKIAGLTEKRDRLEKELAQKSLGLQQSGQWLRGQDLMERLPQDAVLVDFLCFERSNLVEQKGSTTFSEDSNIMASIVRRNQKTELVDLGSQAEIGEAVDNWRRLLLSSDPTNDDVELAGRKLREFLWEPLLPYLTNSQTIILSTDGVLGRVSFAALPGREKGTYLIEDHRFTCVPVPRLLFDIVQKDRNDQNDDWRLLLVGDVDYNSAPNNASGTVDNTPSDPKVSRNETQYASLAQTAGEITDIRELFLGVKGTRPESVTMLTKQEASEAAIRAKAHDFRYVHFATHGFFSDPTKKPLTFFGDASESTSQADSQLNDFVQGFSPGQLSGLVLAGANLPARGGDDGILTSDEICYLPLNEVELVVLSACETGLGPVAGGEGLLGVQRAFQVSGSRSVVASLWNVDDVATRRLMDRFYRNLLQQKMSKLDALREAQLWMLNTPESAQGSIVRGKIVRLKKPARDATPRKGERTDPQYWAAFMLSGDWR